MTSRIDEGAGSALIRVEQIGEVFDVPLTVQIEYADGRTETVELAVTEPAVERRVPIKGPVRRIAAKDELTLAEIR